MSIEAQHTVAETPVSKTIPSTEQPEVSPPKATENPAVAEATVGAAITSDDAAPAPATENPVAEGKTIVASYPASEGVLGYKEHGFLKSLRYTKHFFWFGEEPSTAESLSQYVKSEKGEHIHHAAAWAQETGHGVLFHAKRAEDKATPAGVIVLADATTVLKEGTTEFSFTVGKLHHRFQTNTSGERDSWIVAIENKIEAARGMKEDVTSRESYKKTVEGFAVASPTPATVRSSSKGPKKSLDAATAVAATEPAVNPETASNSSSDAEKKAKKAEKNAKKERSQSRKRASIFGMLGKKDEDKEVKKEDKAEKKFEKEHIKEEKKIEKEQVKEEKKVEAEQKKEEAKATHEPSKAVEAAEAAAVAAVPAAAIAAAEKKEDKKEEEITTPTEKKNKRASVFGSLFGKKGVTSPTTEKTEKEVAGPATPAKDSEVLPVSETAPKLDEPIVNKPIDTAAVTAPVDAAPAATIAAPVEEPVKETTALPTAETTSTPKHEKKGGFLGFMKKADTKKDEKKEEALEEKAAEQAAKDPVAAAAVTTDGAADVPAETSTVEPTEAKEDRPAREKRRTSFFGALGTIKKKNTESSDTEGTTPSDVKREKSPLPGKLGGMFRKPSKAVKPADADKPVETATDAAAPKTDALSTEPTTATVGETADSKIVGDVVPGSFVHDAVTTTPEVKTSA